MTRPKSKPKYQYASPYRELGLWAAATPKKVKKQKTPTIFSGAQEKAVPRYGHRFESPMTVVVVNEPHVTIQKRTRSEKCRVCRQPRFAVDGLPCSGKPQARSNA